MKNSKKSSKQNNEKVKKNRLIIIIGIVLIILIAVLVLIFVNKSGKNSNKEDNTKTEDTSKVEIIEEGTSINESIDVTKDQTVGIFKFTNTKLVYNNIMSTLETIVTNTSSEDSNIQGFNIIVKDENGEEMIELAGFIDDGIKAGEQKVIVASCGIDLTKATSVEYQIIENE